MGFKIGDLVRYAIRGNGGGSVGIIMAWMAEEAPFDANPHSCARVHWVHGLISIVEVGNLELARQ